MKSHALRSGSFSVLIRFFLCIVFACAMSIRSSASVLYWVPPVLGAAGGSSLIEADFMVGHVPADLTVHISRNGQASGSVSLSFAQNAGSLTVLYRSSSISIPANYTQSSIVYIANGHQIGTSTLVVGACLVQPVTSASWHYSNGDPVSSVGAAGNYLRIYIKYKLDANTPSFDAGSLCANVRQPDGTIQEVSGFTNLSSQNTGNGTTYTAYKDYQLLSNTTPNPKNYTIMGAWTNALPHLTPLAPENATVTVRPSIMPIISASWHHINGDPVSSIGASGNFLRIYIKYFNTTEVPGISYSDLRATVRKPDGTTQELSSFNSVTGSQETVLGGYTYIAYNDYQLLSNTTPDPKDYTITAVWASHVPHQVFTPTNATVTVLAPDAVVGGALELEGRVATAPPLPIMFTFYPADGTADFTRTQSADANGAFRFTGIPRNQYTVRIKPINGLATIIPLDVRTNDAVISGVTLRTGDSNDDNAVDIGDLLLLISHYNQAAPDDGYHEASDFTGDGANDIGDLLLLIGNYNQVGE